MEIRLNGNTRQVPEGATILTLLAELNLTPDRVAVELNRRLVKTERYDTRLAANDELEIVTFVGGG